MLQKKSVSNVFFVYFFTNLSNMFQKIFVHFALVCKMPHFTGFGL